jgi:CO dehydrogenase nickel-insertion accessory protein CooC1
VIYRLVTDKLRKLGVPVLGMISFHDDLQQACLEGKPLDEKMASADMENIIHMLQ